MPDLLINKTADGKRPIDDRAVHEREDLIIRIEQLSPHICELTGRQIETLAMVACSEPICAEELTGFMGRRPEGQLNDLMFRGMIKRERAPRRRGIRGQSAYFYFLSHELEYIVKSLEVGPNV